MRWRLAASRGERRVDRGAGVGSGDAGGELSSPLSCAAAAAAAAAASADVGAPPSSAGSGLLAKSRCIDTSSRWDAELRLLRLLRPLEERARLVAFGDALRRDVDDRRPAPAPTSSSSSHSASRRLLCAVSSSLSSLSLAPLAWEALLGSMVKNCRVCSLVSGVMRVMGSCFLNSAHLGEPNTTLRPVPGVPRRRMLRGVLAVRGAGGGVAAAASCSVASFSSSAMSPGEQVWRSWQAKGKVREGRGWLPTHT